MIAMMFVAFPFLLVFFILFSSPRETFYMPVKHEAEFDAHLITLKGGF